MAKVIRDEKYADIARTFIRVQLMGLNDTFLDHGMSDPALRKRLCTQYLSGLGKFLDEYWMGVDEEEFYPLLCFTHRYLDEATSIEEVEPIYAPHGLPYPQLVQEEIEEFFASDTPTPPPVRLGTADEPHLITPRIVV